MANHRAIGSTHIVATGFNPLNNIKAQIQRDVGSIHFKAIGFQNVEYNRNMKPFEKDRNM